MSGGGKEMNPDKKEQFVPSNKNFIDDLNELNSGAPMKEKKRENERKSVEEYTKIEHNPQKVIMKNNL